MHYQRWRRLDTTELPTRHATCTIDGCDRPADRLILGLCEAHYYQKRRNGEIVSVAIKEHRRTGCKEPGCEKPHAAQGWCQMHYTRWQRHGDPNHVGKPARRCGEDHYGWRGDDVGYGAVHQRIRRERGSASTHPCQHCGGQASHWAYDHTDPAERTAPRLGAYSTDPGHYLPLCVSCHKRFDLARLASR